MATRAFGDNKSNGPTKGFSNIQKGKLMGWCGVTTWQYMPRIWKAIKKARTDKDLRFILQQEWDKYKTRLNV